MYVYHEYENVLKQKNGMVQPLYRRRRRAPTLDIILVIPSVSQYCLAALSRRSTNDCASGLLLTGDSQPIGSVAECTHPSESILSYTACRIDSSASSVPSPASMCPSVKRR